MDSTARAILADMEKGKFAPVYFLQGEETYYIDLLAQYVEAHALPQADRSFNQVILYGKDISVPQVLTHARRYPMMAERQVVIVREAQDMADLQKDPGAGMLLSYLRSPAPSTILVFAFKHKTLDKRKELGKKIDELCVSVTFKKPYDSQLPEFILGYAKRCGRQIEEAAVRLLAEYVGNDLNRLTNEIDKVMIGMPDEAPIAASDVMAKVGISRDYNIFELQKAIAQRQVHTAFKIVNYFEANPKRNPAIPVVAFLFSFFSKLLMASGLPDKSERALVTNLKISPFAAREYSVALRQFRTEQIQRIIQAIAQTDLKLKGVDSTGQSDGQLLKELVARIMF
jgi:DNA polymerase-3 subunit delta